MTYILSRLEAEWDHIAHRPRRYHQSQPPKEAPVSLATITTDIRNGIHDVEAHVHDWVTAIEPHLGALADLATSAEQSPLVQAALAAVLPPEVEAELAALVTKMHQAWGAQPAPATAAEPNLQAGEQPAPVQ
jgi:hypothetical protein